ncbi:unnamed protein product [Brachionus calyciflorus]|uniref:MARVEL domain-containing protein n=1 Tax=Brachionus calyciflorus TaxID=104777 RepID=A0A813MI45_9BILA|nr:unnamed protein product [Brachionus calyciflorus]
MSTSAAATVVNAAQKAQNFANQTVETARIEVLKEPLGFIKILQFFLALLAFATAVSGSSHVSFKRFCNSTSVASPVDIYEGSFDYPYNLNKAELKLISKQECQVKPDRNEITNESNNIVSSAQFFVFTGVTAFLYSIAFIIIYVFFRHKYNNLVFFPLADFAATCLFTLFWFAGSIAWSKAVGDIQNFTDPVKVIETMKTLCPEQSCKAVKYPNYANIIVSCILGFGNLILWAGDVWFVLKETNWYKTREEMRQQGQNTTNNPISPNDISITAHYNPNNKI